MRLAALCIGFFLLGAAFSESSAQPRGSLAVCNQTQPAQRVYASLLRGTLTWDGWQAASVHGWWTIEPGDCQELYWSSRAEDFYVYVEYDRGGVAGGERRGGTASASFAPARAYWCVTNGPSNEWPDNTNHLIRSQPSCPSGSRVASAVNMALDGFRGDQLTLNVR